ncbi:hypothetical protein [Puniceicoccus vermicola]|uniref:Uncharacterized protein n=1 Tax=Puniceicoccus vermicola TaxID=388746 RepID=A0A7X1B010_9BACT|nr:hypothetical protein [Puniceicoccus vermicola]MBC2601995.1 hypothetical protein [Puniceicoccus vermicola]
MSKSVFPYLFSALFLFLLTGLSGCATAAEIEESDGNVMEEDPSLEDQGKINN